MIFERYAQCFGNRIQRMFSLCRKHDTRYSDCIDVCKIMLYPLPVAVFLDKAHIEFRIVRHKHTALAELHKFRQHYLYRLCPHHHIIGDTCQFLNPEGNRNLRVHKGRETVYDPSLRYLDRTDFDDTVLNR